MTGEQLWDHLLAAQFVAHPDTNPEFNIRWEKVPEGIQVVWEAAAKSLTFVHPLVTEGLNAQGEPQGWEGYRLELKKP